MSFLDPNVGNAFIISTGVSFTASYAFSKNFSRACLSAGLAGVATLIDGMTTTLLKKYCFQAERKKLGGERGLERKLRYIEIPKKIVLALLTQNLIFRLAGVPAIKADIDHSRLALLPPDLAEATLRFKSLRESPHFIKTLIQINVATFALLGVTMIKKPVYTFF